MKKLITTWIVVADSHKAFLFKKTNSQKSDLALIHQLKAELDENHNQPGRTFNSTGKVRHSIEPHTDPRDVEKYNFAHLISGFLDDIFKHTSFDNLILIAPPKILGMIDKELAKQIHKKLTHKLSKDIVDMKLNDMHHYVEEVITSCQL